MKIVNPFLFLFLTICFYTTSCRDSKAEKDNSNNSIVIDLQPFTDISTEEKNYVYTQLKKVYPSVELKEALKLPASSFYASKNRYRADSLIVYLRSLTPKGHVTIGLTAKDISTTKNKVADWGVIGLGFCPGKSCIVSSFRLSPKEKLMQLFKVSVHELGHTQGLQHCSVKSCFMRDAEGRNPTNEETGFCKTCKAFLVEKGWHFN